MASPLILIGPMYAGKSTVAGLLAKRVGVRRICMDHVRFEYYKEIGYNETHQKEAYDRGGFVEMVKYWKPFEAHAVERLLADHGGEHCVVDFGAGHSVYEDPALFERVREALKPYPVVLLLPSPNVEESIAMLRIRRDELHPSQVGHPTDVNEHFLQHPSNAMLAKFTVYTADRSPDQTAVDVMNAVREVWGLH